MQYMIFVAHFHKQKPMLSIIFLVGASRAQSFDTISPIYEKTHTHTHIFIHIGRTGRYG